MTGGNIKVVVRVRPFNNREKDRGAKCIVQMKGSQTVLSLPPNADNSAPRKGAPAKSDGPKVFNFDRSYWSFSRADPHYAGQENLFEDLGGPLLDNAFKGYNNCIFAYGQTGSGKSYSMMGYGEEAGIIPKICANMFERIADAQQDPNLKCTVEVSYLEIYNERVRDLLNPTTKGALKVREHPSLGPYVEDLAKLVVGSFREIENLMDEGNKARTVAATNMNETSSRSHAVFTLILTQKRHDGETNMDTEKVSRISLVDLAGSERATSTGATGARLKEGAEINRSLSTLGRVIAALADLSSGKKKKENVVPYRDSVLTWLLKDSLGGNSMTAMIAAISPADINWDETLSTLRYADSAKRIKNHAVVNEDPNARMIRELKEELAQLRAKLSGGASMPPEENYAEGTPLEKQIVTITASDGSVRKVSKAEIAEQLGASEKLMKEMTQTWEERLEKTQQIQKEREAALEELGISIEKDFIGMSMPKRIPHLVNLSDDPLLAECLVYNIKPGTTHVGNVETSMTAQIRLNGARILKDHCRFENNDGVVTLIPTEGAAVMVNGMRMEGPRRLRTGYRVILGDFHIFRFNHPQEARAERDKLRHSITAAAMASPEHRQSNGFGDISDADSSRPDSPAPFAGGTGDDEWSFARREAVKGFLGEDKVKDMSIEELETIFEEMQKVVDKARRGRLDDDDTESVGSFVGGREKYASTATFDDLSLDTAITVPSTPQRVEQEEQLRQLKEEMQTQLETQKEEFQERLKAAEEANVEIEEIRAEKAKMEEQLASAKKEMQQQLEEQKKEFQQKQQEMETKMEELALAPKAPKDLKKDHLTKREKTLARYVVELWRRRNYVRMAEAVLQHAATLKEAQIMSIEMEKNVFFQFTVVDVGHTLISSYDLFLNDVNTEDDEYLESAAKPCVGVRVMNFKDNLIHLWSIDKLQNRVRQMRQMYQYLDRPEYLQHFRLSDPFSDQILPQYTLIGDTDIPLAPVLESRSQDFELELISPHTCSVVGIIKASLEPSSTEVPRGTVSFNVVMHYIHGFAEREGTEVHAQIYIPGLSATTTTNKISDFDEGPINFESTHTMSAPLNSRLRNSMLRIAVFAKITAVHLEKLMSWDEMRDDGNHPDKRKRKARLAESEFYTEEGHDVFGKVQILELSESGEYLPVEVLQQSMTDAGAYQLHQGIQRRILIHISHSSGEALTWKDISNVKIGNVQLLDSNGHTTDTSRSREITLNIVKGPSIRNSPDGSSSIAVLAQWDSSLHNALILDRTTAPHYRVQVSLNWEVVSDRLSEPMNFVMDLQLQVQSRLVRSPSKFMQIWNATRTVHAAVGNFQIVIRPAVARRAGDLWRMNTNQRYVKGEEYLGFWSPRGVSVVRDFLVARKKRMQAAEVEAVKGFLSTRTTPVSSVSPAPTDKDDEEQQSILKKFLDWWPTSKDPGEVILVNQNCEPPSNGAAFAEATDGSPPRLVAEVSQVLKSKELLKAGYVLFPDETNAKWNKRYLELRKPYLYVHSVPDGDELHAINLTHCRIDHEPQVAKLLEGKRFVFAIYAPHNTYLVATRNDKEMSEWILAIDKTHFGRSVPDAGEA